MAKRKAAKGRTKKRLPKSPNALAVEHLRNAEWLADTVERQTGPIKRDWGGFADIIAVKRSSVLFLQVTSRTNLASRVTKAMQNREARRLVLWGHRVEVWGVDLDPKDSARVRFLKKKIRLKTSLLTQR